MAFSIDERRTALLCLHFQNDIVDETGALKDFGSAAMVAKQATLPKVASLQRAARDVGVKVIHSSVAPAEDDVVVVNKGTSAFSGSNLREELASAGIDVLLLAGVATNFVVESTARQAADLGYKVAVIGDCCASASAEMHEAALVTALPFLATVTDSEQVIAVLRREEVESTAVPHQ